DIPYEQIDVIQHRESVIHSMVEFVDHSVLAQLAVSDMRICIQYAMSFPERLPNTSKSLDLAQYGTLHFEKMDMERFPLLALAYKVGKMEGNMGAVMNGANEMAVRMFLNHQCSYLDIEKAVFAAVENAEYIEKPDLQDIIDSDRWAQDFVAELLKG
ncbi:MAG: 1-deoxy-D-xylulose-5-phosphate reductoisomerase, partial [Erysipelotrichaceae bacterium]|nr:1-deoxy-D-xylulose-5-phosphate reductoisomerase [Erysipelotrichaceae bacterium]